MHNTQKSFEWAIRNGRIVCVCPPVREGKQSIITQPRVRLECGKKQMVASFRRENLRLRVVDTTPPSEVKKGDFLVVTQGFVIELDGQRAVVEFVERRNELLEAKLTEQRKALVAKMAEDGAKRKEEKEQALQTLRAKLADAALIRAVGERLPFSHHNKLWQREEWRGLFVSGLLAKAMEVKTWQVSSLPNSEIEQVRLQIWCLCEELRATRKAAWLAAQLRSDGCRVCGRPTEKDFCSAACWQKYQDGPGQAPEGC